MLVEPFGRQRHRHFVNIVHVRRGNHARFRHVAEERDLGFQFLLEAAIAAAKKNVGLNSDAEQFLHAVLRGLGLQFAGGGDVRHEREMNEERVLRPELEAHLANRFQNGSDSMSPTVPPISTMTMSTRPRLCETRL